MLTEEEANRWNTDYHDTLMGHLGVKVLPSDDEYIWGELPITKKTCQYYGILHGGASLAFAETLAGCGSWHLVQGKQKICGLNVVGNHVGMSAKEGKVIGKATLLHKGRTTHIWNVDITGEDGRLISTERVTNYILD